MSRIEQIKLDVASYAKSTDFTQQRFYARQILMGCHLTRESMHRFLVPATEEQTAKAGVQCPHCARNDFKNQHSLRAHVGMKHKKEVGDDQD